MRVAVQVPAFEEGDSMLPTLRSIRDQRVPEYVEEVSYETWVTLSPPEKELCTTWQAALRAEGFEPHEAPQGKLSTRNAAHDSAVQRGYDVIVSWDADAPAVNDETLFHLLEPFEGRSGSVAVCGEPHPSPTTPFGAMKAVMQKSAWPVTRHIYGRISALSSEAWQCAGPFDDSIEQTDLLTVWREEELGFARRLRSCGDFFHAKRALVENRPRRMHCRFERSFGFSGRQVSDWCDSRGEKTFAPRRPQRDQRYR